MSVCIGTENGVQDNQLIYTTLTADFADSVMTPRLILRHRGQTPRLPSPGHARLALLIKLIKRRIVRRSYQMNPASRGVLSDQPRITRRSCQIMTISYIVYQTLFSHRIQKTTSRENKSREEDV